MSPQSLRIKAEAQLAAAQAENKELKADLAQAQQDHCDAEDDHDRSEAEKAEILDAVRAAEVAIVGLMGRVDILAESPHRRQALDLGESALAGLWKWVGA